MPTETKTGVPNNPKTQERKQKTQTPPPRAKELEDLLKKALAPKQIPINANIAQKLATQNKMVFNGIMFFASGFAAKRMMPAMDSDPKAAMPMTKYIAIKETRR